MVIEACLERLVDTRKRKHKARLTSKKKSKFDENNEIAYAILQFSENVILYLLHKILPWDVLIQHQFKNPLK